MQQNRISNRKLFSLKFIEIFKSFEKRIFRYVEYHRFCDGKPLSFQHHKIYCNKNIKEYLNCSATFFNDFFIIVLAIFFYKRRQRKSKQRNPRHQQRNDSVMEINLRNPIYLQNRTWKQRTQELQQVVQVILLNNLILDISLV